MSCKPDIKTTERWYELYQEGFSLEQIAKMNLVSRQTVFKRFQRRGLKMRTANALPIISFNGCKYTMRSNGYYAKTSGNRSYLHRDVWLDKNGAIPDGFDIHHINGDRQDNRIKNLELVRKDEHSRKYPNRKNQFNKGA